MVGQDYMHVFVWNQNVTMINKKALCNAGKICLKYFSDRVISLNSMFDLVKLRAKFQIRFQNDSVNRGLISVYF